MDDQVIQQLMQQFGMGPEVAANQPAAMVQGAKRGVSPHSTNANEAALIRQSMENEGENAAEAPSDGMLSDGLWKTIQEMGPDGADFYALPGKEALATIGMRNDPELAGFWDKLNEEDRYYLVKALDSSIGGGAMSNKQLADDTLRGMDEDGEASDAEKAIVDEMMKDENEKRAR